MPFAAPCREIAPLAPLQWVRLGVADLRRAPLASLLYGAVMTIIIASVSLGAWVYGSQLLVLAMICGFVFLAPLTCIGLYAISAQLERGQPVSLTRSLRAAFKRCFGNEMVFALVLLVIFFIWARSGMLVIAFMTGNEGVTHQNLLGLLGVGSAMLVWLVIIALGLLLGFATAFIGLVVILPVIGYGAWHGYLQTIDASAFPRHEVGITSVPRT